MCSTHARALTQKHTHNTDGDDVNDSALKPSQIGFDRSLSSLCVCVVRARVCVCRTRSFSLSSLSAPRLAALLQPLKQASPPPLLQTPTSCARAGSQPTLSLSLSLSQTRSAPAAEAAAGNQTNTARAANHHVFEVSAAQNNTAMLTHALHTNTQLC